MSVFYIPTTDSTSSTTLNGDVTGSTSSSYISDLTVTSKLLTGMVISPGIVTAADSIRAAIGKLAAGFTSISTNSIESLGTTLNIATQNNTQTVNLGSGTGIQTINVGNSGTGATTINIGGGTDSVNISKAYIANSLSFPIGDVRKRLAIFDDANPADLADHRFNGIGKASYMQVYQAKTTAENHVFFAATSATTSNELFRIAGSGAVSCAGSLTAGSLVATGAVTAGSITTGILTSTSGAAITGAVTVASGGITVQNGVSCSALTTSNLIFPSGTLSYYEEYDHVTAFSVAGVTSLSVTIRFTRIGRQVTAHVPEVVMTNPATLTQGPAISSVAFPVRFRSSNPFLSFVSANNGSLSPVFSAGCATISSAGLFVIYPLTPASVFSINGAFNFGFGSFSATWTVL